MYDFNWYIKKRVTPDLDYLKAKLVESGVLKNENVFTIEDLKALLTKKFENTDWEKAKQDVTPFIKDGRELELWSASFFLSLLKGF